jgi:hypothetical protein
MGDRMTFPKTFDEFAEQYKITDTKQVYTNGTEMIPIFRVKQWLEHTAGVVEVVRCKDCVHYCGFENCKNGICDRDVVSKRAVYPYDFCSYGERKDETTL